MPAFTEPGLGELYASRFCHCLRQDADGTWEIRSRFWLGFETEMVGGGCRFPPKMVVDILANTWLMRSLKIPASRALALHKHSAEEFSALASVLPAMFEEHAAPHWKSIDQ